MVLAVFQDGNRPGALNPVKGSNPYTSWLAELDDNHSLYL